ncbi:hypothetical protein KIW84_065052 [Lathyrus oleraceus]|nr:hypothetical protein KIW84_065052 [Pisum sativum]
MPHRILSSQQRRQYHKRTTSQPSIDGAFKPNHRQNSDLNKLSFNSKTDDSLHNLNSPILLHDTNSTPSALNVNDAEQARVRALEDLQKILAEKKALQGEINVLEMSRNQNGKRRLDSKQQATAAAGTVRQEVLAHDAADSWVIDRQLLQDLFWLSML